MPTTTILAIRKRDGTKAPFQQSKISDAIYKAMLAVGEGTREDALMVSNDVIKGLAMGPPGQIPTVEQVQDLVVNYLRERGFEKVAIAYEDYRRKKDEIRRLKGRLSLDVTPKLTVNSLEVLKKRYLLRNEKGEIIETPPQLFRRVAHAIAEVDRIYGEDPASAEEEFYGLMSRLEFMPNSPTLFNAGTGSNFALAACYVLPVEDSLEGIFTTLKNTALIEQTGGGVGFDFSRIRPSGDLVRSTKGVASGPVSFMKIFDSVTDVIKTGGRRRGAMMAILRVDHPDILQFISSKAMPGTLTNFNISVSITDSFMEALDSGKGYDLINPRTGGAVDSLSAKFVWGQIIENAWKSGDPGVLFIDEINRHNPTPDVGRIEATNPCGEQPLLPYESCNLGSINLSKMVTKEGGIDWQRLATAVRSGIHFLDNVIDANPYPLAEIDRLVKSNRKIGLGVMGFAELLIRMNIPYDSEEALRIGERIAGFMEEEAARESEELALRRGSFPNFERSLWCTVGGGKGRRNATVTTIAPTGTISIIAGCSSGIEPLFAIAFMRNVMGGTRLYEINPLFEMVAKERGFYSSQLLERIVTHGSLKDVDEIPEDIRRIFVTSHEILPSWHVRMQASFQKHTENAVSKTVNLPQEATYEDVETVYSMAYRLKCKGVTVYRYGSKGEQVLNLGIGGEDKRRVLIAGEDYAGGTPIQTCLNCG
jgi:ribonucleoside-diphosphate reductase alpha chain